MSSSSDSSEITAPKDPAAYRPRALLGPTFWALLALCVLCVLAGVAIADYGPKLFTGKPAARSAAEPAPAAEAAAPTAAPAPPAPLPAAAAQGPSPDVARLSTRLATLENQQAHAAQAAAAALAAASVAEASQGTGPFADELASLRAMAPPSPELESLARLAQAGAPSRTALAAAFPEFAARASSAARAPGKDAGLGDRIVYALSKVVTLRRVGDVPGDSVDAMLARAERQVEDGDLDRALRTLDKLPPGSREAIAPWRARAERRAEIDRSAQALRARALQTLAAESRSGG